MYLVPIAPETEPSAALLGQKGAGLVTMCRLGLPVPPGVLLSTDFWRDVRHHLRHDPKTPLGGLPDAVWQPLWVQLEPLLHHLGLDAAVTNAAAPQRPTVLAVRAGAAVSMPGMLTSILNVGLCPAQLPTLANWAGSRRFALDCYARFLQQLTQALATPKSPSASTPAAAFATAGWSAAGALSRRDPHAALPTTDDALIAAAHKLRDDASARLGTPVPDDLPGQLRAALGAVLRSVDSPRSVEYRALYGLPDDQGTAVVIQAMVYGNLDDRSATGVLFTRDPSTGVAPTATAPYGEFLPCAQGEDVVGGSAYPHPIAEMSSTLPAPFADLRRCAAALERHAGDMQDIEFTVERGRLWLLQTRAGKRSALSMVRIAVDLCREGTLSPAAALSRIDAARLVELLHPTIDPHCTRTQIARGLPASPGVAIGRAVFSSGDVEAHARVGEPTILVRIDTSPDDILGIRLCAGVLTARGGLTSHAAVIARGLGRCAVVGASSLMIDPIAGTATTRELIIRRGDILTIDGHTGEVLLGAVPLSTAKLTGNRELTTLLDYARATRRLRILAHVEGDSDVQLARDLGAQGLVIGRSERWNAPLPAPLRDAAAPATDPSTILRLLDPVAAQASAQLLRTASSTAAASPHVPLPQLLDLWLPQLGRAIAESSSNLSILVPLHRAAPADRLPLLHDLRSRLAPTVRLGAQIADRAAVADLAAIAPLCDFIALAPSPLLSEGAPSPRTTAPTDWLNQLSLSQALQVARSAPRTEPADAPLAIGLIDSDPGPTSWHPAVIAWCVHQRIDFVSCPPLRIAVAAIAAAQQSPAP